MFNNPFPTLTASFDDLTTGRLVITSRARRDEDTFVVQVKHWEHCMSKPRIGMRKEFASSRDAYADWLLLIAQAIRQGWKRRTPEAATNAMSWWATEAPERLTAIADARGRQKRREREAVVTDERAARMRERFMKRKAKEAEAAAKSAGTAAKGGK